MSAPRVGPRTLAGLVIALTFLVGGLAGAVMDRTVVRPALHAERRPEMRGGPRGRPDAGSARDKAGRERGRERFVQQMTRELSLNPPQVARIDAITRAREEKMGRIWAEVQPRVHALIDETRAEIDQVLTPEQRAKLHELRKQHEARMKADSAARDSARDTTQKR